MSELAKWGGGVPVHFGVAPWIGRQVMIGVMKWQLERRLAAGGHGQLSVAPTVPRCLRYLPDIRELYSTQGIASVTRAPL